LKLEGLNANGGDNTALVDAVKLNATLVTNGGFETPALADGGYVFNPTGATWTFTGTTGIARNGSAFTNNNPNAPEGKQVGIVQMTGSISQPRALTTGTYNLNLRAAQRGSGNASFQQVRASLQSAAIVVLSTKQYVWNGTTMAEERDANNVVIRRFYPQGEQISGSSYYYTRDHLGSIREFIDSSGAVRARYDYDPYGFRIKLSGDLDASFGYTGHYFHQPSGLNLAMYRAYTPTLGRWISRDPLASGAPFLGLKESPRRPQIQIGERLVGANLYDYVHNQPLDQIDLFGLITQDLYTYKCTAVDVTTGLDTFSITYRSCKLDAAQASNCCRQAVLAYDAYLVIVGITRPGLPPVLLNRAAHALFVADFESCMAVMGF
jgi:RHS repeat-associated protein